MRGRLGLKGGETLDHPGRDGDVDDHHDHDGEDDDDHDDVDGDPDNDPFVVDDPDPDMLSDPPEISVAKSMLQFHPKVREANTDTLETDNIPTFFSWERRC